MGSGNRCISFKEISEYLFGDISDNSENSLKIMILKKCSIFLNKEYPNVR